MIIDDIDKTVKVLTQQFSTLIAVFNYKSDLERYNVKTLQDVEHSKNSALKFIQGLSFDAQDLLDDIAEDIIEEGWQEPQEALQIKQIYADKLYDVINKNTSILLLHHIQNAKDMVLRNKKQQMSNLVVYQHDLTTTRDGKHIFFDDKFRKDVRKVLIDYFNDLKLFGAYKQGKTWAYTVHSDGSLKKEFLIADYVKSQALKDSIFHPNAQSLAYVRE